MHRGLALFGGKLLKSGMVWGDDPDPNLNPIPNLHLDRNPHPHPHPHPSAHPTPDPVPASDQVWGEDMLLEAAHLRSPFCARALNYLEVLTITRLELEETAAAFPKVAMQVRPDDALMTP